MAKTTKTPAAEIAPYLKSVRIRDYAPLRDAKVDFKPGLNVIIGPNGAGKTRFLSLTNNLANLYAAHTEGVNCEIVVGGAYEINASFHEPAESENPSFGNPDSLPNLEIYAAYGGLEKRGAALEDVLEDLVDEWNEVNNPRSLANASFDYDLVFIQHGLPDSPLPIIEYGTELSFGKRFKIYSKEEKKLVSEIESRFVRTLLITINQIIRRAYKRQRGSFITQVSVQIVRNAVEQAMDVYLAHLNGYLPHYSPVQAVRCTEVFQVTSNPVQDEILVEGLVLQYLVSGNWLSFRMLSDGTKRLFYLLAELVSPNFIDLNQLAVWPTNSSNNRIIFLEEPELGIHPHQLTKLLNLIREVSRENQVILTTHAPQVLDMLTKDELDRITVCRLDPKKGTQFLKLSKAKQEQARIYMKEVGFLSDYWRYSYLEETETE